MKKLFSLFTALLISVVSLAQGVVAESSEIEIDKIARPGLEIVLKLEKKQVKEYWKKHLKQYGKVETSGNEFNIKAAKVPSLSSDPVSIISKVDKTGKGVVVFWAIDLGDKWVSSGGKGYTEAKKILQDFGITAYKNDINDQIKEAEKNLKKAEKAQEKSEKEGEKLKNDLKKNGEDKIRLENDLVKNKEDKGKLEQDIESNKKDQSKKKEEVGEAKKALDKVKAKLDNF